MKQQQVSLLFRAWVNTPPPLRPKNPFTEKARILQSNVEI